MSLLAAAPFDPVWSPIFIAMLAVTLTHSVVALTLLHVRKDRFPISGHSPVLVSIIVITAVIGNVAHMTAGIRAQRVSCGILFGFTLLIFFTISAFFVRAWRLWYRYLLAGERVSGAVPSASASGSPAKHELLLKEGTGARWFREHAHWFTEARLVVVALVAGALQWLATFAAYLANPHWEELASDSACPSIRLGQTVGQIFIGFNLIYVSYVAYKVRRIYDAYGIKAELIHGLVESLFLFVVVVGRDRWFDNNVYRVLWWCGAQAVIFTSCTLKVYQSSWHPRARNFSVLSSRESSISRNEPSKLSEKLASVFSDADLLDEFTEHLKREFSVENLLFCQAAKDFRDRCRADAFDSDEERRELAVRIYYEFIPADAPSQVNLSARFPAAITKTLAPHIRRFAELDSAASPCVSVSITRKEESESGGSDVDSVPEDVFEDARKQIYRLMENDTFVRFKTKRQSISVSMSSQSGQQPPRGRRSIVQSRTFVDPKGKTAFAGMTAGSPRRLSHSLSTAPTVPLASRPRGMSQPVAPSTLAGRPRGMSYSMGERPRSLSQATSPSAQTNLPRAVPASPNVPSASPQATPTSVQASLPLFSADLPSTSSQATPTSLNASLQQFPSDAVADADATGGPAVRLPTQNASLRRELMTVSRNSLQRRRKSEFSPATGGEQAISPLHSRAMLFTEPHSMPVASALEANDNPFSLESPSSDAEKISATLV